MTDTGWLILVLLILVVDGVSAFLAFRHFRRRIERLEAWQFNMLGRLKVLEGDFR